MGQLVVSAAGIVIPAVVSTVQSWLKRNEGRSVTLEIGTDKLQVAGVSSKQQDELIKSFVSRHSTMTETDG
jgi:hypothetical protein